MSYRKLSMINGNGVTWTFTDPSNKTFATGLDGFGFSNTTSLLRLGDMNYISYSLNNLDAMSLELLFYEDTVERVYTDYNDFVSFLSVGSLYLIYDVPSVNVYRRPVIVQGLTKSEISADTSALQCTLSLMPVGFWEDNTENTVTITSGYQNITINGNMETPVNYTLTGSAMSNPQLIARKGSTSADPTYNVARFIGTYNSVAVISEELSESITLLNSSNQEVSNPYNYQDLASVQNMDEVEHVTFFKLRPGVSRITVSGSNITIVLTWRSRYASV